MQIFPIGTVSSGSSNGTLSDQTYSMFEPNGGCYAQTIHSILTTTFMDQILLTRKQALPYLTLTYIYNDIFDKEYKQIEHFVYELDDALTSFYTVDFSNGRTPSNISAAGDWTVTLDNTRLFSSIAHQKAHHAFLWDGYNWKEGAITSVTSTTIVVDVDTNNYGALTLADAQSGALVYPLYEVRFSPNVLHNFKTTNFLKGDITTGDVGGFIWQGQVVFISKYKV